MEVAATRNDERHQAAGLRPLWVRLQSDMFG